jgi:hypothetical protein
VGLGGMGVLDGIGVFVCVAVGVLVGLGVEVFVGMLVCVLLGAGVNVGSICCPGPQPAINALMSITKTTIFPGFVFIECIFALPLDLIMIIYFFQYLLSSFCPFIQREIGVFIIDYSVLAIAELILRASIAISLNIPVGDT